MRKDNLIKELDLRFAKHIEFYLPLGIIGASNNSLDDCVQVDVFVDIEMLCIRLEIFSGLCRCEVVVVLYLSVSFALMLLFRVVLTH